MYQRCALRRRGQCRGARPIDMPQYGQGSGRPQTNALLEAGVDEDARRDERHIRRRARGAGQHGGDMRPRGVLLHRSRPHHAHVRHSRGFRHRGGVSRALHRARFVRRVHARRERQRDDERRRGGEEDRQVGRVRQALSYKVGGRLFGQADDGPRQGALRRSAVARGGRAVEIRAAHHEDDGFPGILPHRAGLHLRGARATRRVGRPGTWFGGGFGCGLLFGYHADRPHQIRPSVRAFP